MKRTIGSGYRRASFRPWYFGALASIVLACAPFSPAAQAETGQAFAEQTGASLIGREVPPLVLTSIDGQRIDLGALRGHKAIYLKFWATWCSPCREQMPHFEKAQRGAGDDLAVIAINAGFDDSVEQVHAFGREYGLTMPIVRDGDGRLGEVFGLRVTPQHIIVGRDGRIAYVGHLADAKLDAALAAARASQPKAIATAAAKPLARDPAPSAVLTTIDGTTIALADPSGRPTRLAFFAPWCESYFEKTRPQASSGCRAIRERLTSPPKGERWIAISLGLWTSADDLREYREKNHVDVPLVLDADGSLFRRFGVREMPAAFELDGHGGPRQLEVAALRH